MFECLRERFNSANARDQLICGLCFSTAMGAAIAPPPSLTESSSPTPMEPPAKMATPQGGGGSLAGLGIAAKIMAKYGYKVNTLLIIYMNSNSIEGLILNNTLMFA